MSGSYRRFFIAAGLGLTLFAIGAWTQRAAIWADGPSTYPEYRETGEDAQKRLSLATPQQASKTVENQQPCRNPQGHDASDLCAQWRAADAAQRSARWAWWQMVFSLAGIGGLIVTLWFNFEAWDQAKSSKVDTERALKASEDNAKAALRLADTAETNAKKELRAYLDFDGVQLEEYPPYNGEGPDEIGMRLRIHVRNYGKTPSQNAESTIATTAKLASDEGGNFQPITSEDRKFFDSIAPSDEFKIRFFWRIPRQILEALKSKKMRCRVYVCITYTDVFGDPHVLRCEFENANGLADEFSMVEGTRAST